MKTTMRVTWALVSLGLLFHCTHSADTDAVVNTGVAADDKTSATTKVPSSPAPTTKATAPPVPSQASTSKPTDKPTTTPLPTAAKATTTTKATPGTTPTKPADAPSTTGSADLHTSTASTATTKPSTPPVTPPPTYAVSVITTSTPAPPAPPTATDKPGTPAPGPASASTAASGTSADSATKALPTTPAMASSGLPGPEQGSTSSTSSTSSVTHSVTTGSKGSSGAATGDVPTSTTFATGPAQGTQSKTSASPVVTVPTTAVAGNNTTAPPPGAPTIPSDITAATSTSTATTTTTTNTNTNTTNTMTEATTSEATPRIFSFRFAKGDESNDDKELAAVCQRFMVDMHDASCTLTGRRHNGKTEFDSVTLAGKVSPKLATQYYEEITRKPVDNTTLIAILASCGALLAMIIGLAIYASHHRKPYNENQQHLTEELHTVENGYHDNPTLEVMEVQPPEMQEKKVALNGEFNDSWIVPFDNMAKEDIPDEEDTHL